MSRTILTAVVTAASIALFAGAPNAQTIPERLMADLARDFRLQDFQAAGITGNLARETGNFRFMQELEPIVEGSRGGIGYSQWTASRRVSFEKYAGSLQKQLTYEVNYGYLKKELNGEYREVIDEVRKSKNLWEATVIFMRGYLKPKKNPDNIRVSMNYGSAYLRGNYDGAGCQRHHDVTIDGRRMMIAACPETTIPANGQDVGVILALSERPAPRPENPARIRVADASLQTSNRPQARPGQADTGQPRIEAVRDAVLVAMNTEAVRAAIQLEPEDHQDEPCDPEMEVNPFHARREEDPEDQALPTDDETSFSMFA